MFDIHIHSVTPKNIKIIMEKLDELSAKVDALQVALDAVQDTIGASIDGLNQTIIELQAQLADGATPEAVQAIIDKVDAIKVDLESTIPTTGEGVIGSVMN
jgi:flagellin-like hook-associated protein FlgL